MSMPGAGGRVGLSTWAALKPLQASVWSHARAIPLLRDLGNHSENKHQFLGRLMCFSAQGPGRLGSEGLNGWLLSNS